MNGREKGRAAMPGGLRFVLRLLLCACVAPRLISRTLMSDRSGGQAHNSSSSRKLPLVAQQLYSHLCCQHRRTNCSSLGALVRFGHTMTLDGNHTAAPSKPEADEDESATPSPPPQRRYSDFSIDSILRSDDTNCYQWSTDIRRNDCQLSAGKDQSAYCRLGRKQRTIYRAQQTLQLEQAFACQQYMVGADREVLARQLGLTESQVRIWFQNRRSKWRKELRRKNSAG